MKKIILNLRTTGEFEDIDNAVKGRENTLTNLTGRKLPKSHILKLIKNKLFKRTVAIINDNGDIQYFHIVYLGKNGNGSLKEDLTELLKIINNADMKWVDMTIGRRDIPDDTSAWAITFRL
jgi:hypothetical protein